MKPSIVIDTDSYKVSHWLQYPPGTENLFTYIESRGGHYSTVEWVMLQYYLMEYLSKPVTIEDVEEGNAFWTAHGEPFNYEGWKRIVNEFGGYLPVRIKALDEGTIVPTGFPLLTCEATHKDFFWVPGWLETSLLRTAWYGTTVGTQSYHLKQVIKRYLNETADNLGGLPFKLHDFGSRGVSSQESAMVGGAAHLVNFMGSDTGVGVWMANKYYNSPMSGFSIPAAEHSTITSWGKSGELAAYRNMLQKFAKPGAILAVVSDSYDIYNAVENLWGDQLKKEVQDSGATVVIRPDSGDPIFVVSKLLNTLHYKFGSTINNKGYRLLNNVRVIQGDGVNPFTIEKILQSTKLAGFSADNLAFGMGGALLQQVNRDTQKFADKCSSATIVTDGLVEERPVFKDPVDDPGKRSKSGRIGTANINGVWTVVPESSPDNLLKERYVNGQLLNTTDFATVRANSER